MAVTQCSLRKEKDVHLYSMAVGVKALRGYKCSFRAHYRKGRFIVDVLPDRRRRQSEIVLLVAYGAK